MDDGLRSKLRLGRGLSDKRDNGTAQLHIANVRESFGQGHAIRCRGEVADVGRRLGARPNRIRQTNCVRHTFEEKGNGHSENSTQQLQAARADAISPFLVFLALLERHAKRVAHFDLAHVEHNSAHPNAAADMLVYRIDSHLCPRAI
jgi:hypothetical protein